MIKLNDFSLSLYKSYFIISTP